MRARLCHVGPPPVTRSGGTSVPEGVPVTETLLNNFASKDMPGRQREIQDTVGKILAVVGGTAEAT
jgi:hypothetical protein